MVALELVVDILLKLSSVNSCLFLRSAIR